ncbi:hypothetical protein [Streptomyces sp. APSN-46.1]|uniref:hypothetical protein n=1 Tax=Streptomyces sp. APSN-46.1 TaxID=2929049 RepID=UPI001FB2182A|nr:hypothetical protein [Streptomyces sp. APSN-46.1]
MARMQREAFDLSRLQMVVETSRAHPHGVCATDRMTCAGCRLSAPIATLHGGPMADCRLCGYGWAVWHHPVRCWQR